VGALAGIRDGDRPADAGIAPGDERDPVGAYPRPPFPGAQQQPRPGLTGPMDPAPDHGEESYVGARPMPESPPVTSAILSVSRPLPT
jgi:hypothetical protein